MTNDSHVNELAKLIIGNGSVAESWLLNGLNSAVAGIAWAVRQADKEPSREQLRQQIQTALDAAKFLQKQLRETVFLRTLASLAEDDLHGDNQAYNGLGSLTVRLEKALTQIPTGSNRHEFEPGARSPKLICALAICTLWKRMRGSLPGHASESAQQACLDLWILAEQPQDEKGSGNLSSWLRHLKRAKQELTDNPSTERLFVRSA